MKITLLLKTISFEVHGDKLNATLKHTEPLFINKTVDRDIENNNESDKHGSHNSIITAFA